MRRAHAALALVALFAGVTPGAAPLRVATLLPYVEDALVPLDPSTVVVVATVRRDLHAPPPAAMIDLGNPHSPSFERLAEAGADLIIGDRLMHAALAGRLGAHGEVLLVDSSTVDATLDGLEEIGRRVGAGPAMARAVGETRAGLAAQALATPVPTLLLFGTPGSFMVVSKRTWVGDLVEQVKLQNLGDQVSGSERFPGFVQASDEVLAGLRPELILLIAHGDPTAIRAAFDRKLNAGPLAPLRGSAARGVHVLPGAQFATNPGLRLSDAAAALHELATSGEP
jgi:iron complex transport system substrate-binding protein